MTFVEAVRDLKPDLAQLFPYAPMVPRDPDKNLEWRAWVDECGKKSEEDRHYILSACERDLLFFINGFLTIKQESPVVCDKPFITWPKQEEYVTRLALTRKKVVEDEEEIARGDIVSEKPREQGWSWLNLGEGLHIARFTKGATGLIASRVEYDVDAEGASKTLFWKLDYFIEHMPQWFMPESYWSPRDGFPVPARKYRTRSSGRIKLGVPGFGTLHGSATHENCGRSGRFYWMMLDEFAHADRGQAGMGDKIWSATTKTCRLRRALSSPFGRGNKFEKLVHSGEVERFTTYWYDDPAKMRRAYRLTEPMEVGPVTLNVGDWWSPWMEETRKADDNDALFAQELLLSYEGLGGCYYESLLPKVKHEQVKEPVFVGNVKHDESVKGPRVTRIVRESPGFFKSWEPIPENWIWPTGLYCMGIDVASGGKNQEGRGASNSVVSIGRITGRRLVKIAQYQTHGLFPHRFARVVCALGWCFRSQEGLPAYAIWEANGPGASMGGVLMGEFGYTNVWWETAMPGFQMQTHRKSNGELAGSRVNVFNEHKAWLDLGDYEEPSYDTYREMEQYQYTDDAGARHQKCKDSLDPSEGHDNHGDSVIATVLMIWAAKKLREQQGERTVEADPPRGSVAYWQKQRRRELSGAWR